MCSVRGRVSCNCLFHSIFFFFFFFCLYVWMFVILMKVEFSRWTYWWHCLCQWNVLLLFFFLIIRVVSQLWWPTRIGFSAYYIYSNMCIIIIVRWQHPSELLRQRWTKCENPRKCMAIMDDNNESNALVASVAAALSAAGTDSHGLSLHFLLSRHSSFHINWIASCELNHW